MLADVSQSIPETGGGISGFVAHGLWHIYRHFPSSGRYDYLLLFVFLMVLVRILFLPYVLKALNRDIAGVSKDDSKAGIDDVTISMIWDTVDIWLLVWFFYTDAGKTFLVGRTFFGQELTEPGLFGVSLFCWFAVIVLMGVVIGVREAAWDKAAPNVKARSWPYHEAISGGICVSFLLLAMMILAAHVLYWYWSRATILLFWSFFVAVVLTETLRVTAIYILLGRAVGPLVRALSDDNWRVGQTGTKALGQPGEKGAVDLLIEALSEGRPYARRFAAKALGLLGDKRAIDPLIEALSDDKCKVRHFAAYALGQLGDERAVDPLIKALGDDVSVVRFVVASALGQLGDKRAVDPLIKVLEDKTEIVRWTAASALGLLGDKRAVDPLIKALSDDASMVHSSAKEALKKLGHEE